MRLQAALAALVALAAPTALIAADAPVAVVAAPSAAQPFEDFLVLRGRTEAHRYVEIRSEISGLIVSEPIRKGASVEEGQILCRIDTGEKAAELAEARARLTKAQADQNAAEVLVQKGYTSETSALGMSASLEAARAMVDRAEIALGRLEIVAPFAGILETDTAELGALMQPGSTCATLIALDPIAVVAYAPERNVDALRVGAPGVARLINGREIDGEIGFVSRSAEESTRTYRVELIADNADGSVRDGMTAEIIVSIASTPAHFIPQTALTLDDDGVLGVKIVDAESRARFIPVSVLRETMEGVWVSGPPEQASIIIVGQEFVIDGEDVVATPPSGDLL